MIKKTIIQQIEVQPETGFVFLRLHKRTLDGNKVVREENHRTVLGPITDIDAQAAAVNDHLIQMGEAPVDLTEWELVKRHAELVRTPALVAAWTKKQADEAELNRVQQEARRAAERDAKAAEDARFKAAVAEAIKQVSAA